MSSLISDLFDLRCPVVGSLKKKGALQMEQTADKEEKDAGIGTSTFKFNDLII